ncbi:tRNA 4-thiouridine(8) synthase ThiI [Candidatus Woesearchaeota archaeon]|nr:tRNA 4-thiouridine(8) synthase ThiI [Candidatus Woesearchaeota archaeon]
MVIIVRYAEIGLKGKNRVYFEQRLVQNIKNKIKNCKVTRPRGRILIETEEENIKVLDKIFGISSYSIAKEIKMDIESIKSAVFELAKEKEDSFDTFKIQTKRMDKTFPMKSPEINVAAGERVFEELKKEVSFKNPDLVINVELIQDRAFIFSDVKQGLKGLPVGVSGRVMSLLSGGIDSPVSSLLTMKRGCDVHFIHFHNFPYVKQASIDKVKDLFNIVREFENNTRLYMVPFTDAQKEVVAKCASKYRILLYRRIMVKIATIIAKRNKCRSLVTGENLGQVASQTLNNMFCVNEATDMLVLRPLVGLDKIDIIELAQKYETFEKSIEPHDDCCTFFMPQNPETNAKLELLKKEEEKIDVEAIVKDCIDKIEIIE